MKFYLTTLLIFWGSVGIGQMDSTYNVAVSANFVSSKIPATSTPFKVYTLSARIKKGNHTIVPLYSNKLIHGMAGNQVGLSYYLKWKNGYGSVEGYYSKDDIFPSFLIRSNVYFLLAKGLELSIGGANITYANDEVLRMVDIGATYYFGAFMASYTAKIPVSKSPFHILFLRKYLRNEVDYIQFGATTGLDVQLINVSTNRPVAIYGFQFKMHKQIVKKSSLSLSIGTTKAKKDISNSLMFNFSIGLTKEF